MTHSFPNRRASDLEQGVKQTENQQQHQRHDDREPCRGRLQLFKGTAVLDVITAWQFGFSIDAGAKIIDETAQVTVAHVGGDNRTPLAVLAADLIGSSGERYFCQDRKSTRLNSSH